MKQTSGGKKKLVPEKISFSRKNTKITKRASERGIKAERMRWRENNGRWGFCGCGALFFGFRFSIQELLVEYTKKKENTNGTRVEKNKNIGFRVKLQTPSGKWICKAEKEAPLPGRVFKNIYIKRKVQRNVCENEKNVFESRGIFICLKDNFFRWPFWCIIHTQSHTFFPHTHTHSYESSGLFLGFVFHFVFFFYSLLVFVFSTFGDVSTYKLVRVFRARGGKLHAWNISSTCQQIIIVIWL